MSTLGSLGWGAQVHKCKFIAKSYKVSNSQYKFGFPKVIGIAAQHQIKTSFRVLSPQCNFFCIFTCWFYNGGQFYNCLYCSSFFTLIEASLKIQLYLSCRVYIQQTNQKIPPTHTLMWKILIEIMLCNPYFLQVIINPKVKKQILRVRYLTWV